MADCSEKPALSDVAKSASVRTLKVRRIKVFDHALTDDEIMHEYERSKARLSDQGRLVWAN
ncbi:hypothetical protein ABEB22_18255 (plasmid) [Thioclava sp. 'Guangxiensis']|uniref:hypothetical protein n=1 Tax=Thioclava sp. 'Guangxiensis' TaxID=3149044 RepID=UPI0032C453C0